jgi:hypothetical protein
VRVRDVVRRRLSLAAAGGQFTASSRPARTAPKPHLCGRCFACARERAVRISPAPLLPRRGRAVVAVWGLLLVLPPASALGAASTARARAACTASTPRCRRGGGRLEPGFCSDFQRVLLRRNGGISHGGFDHILRSALAVHASLFRGFRSARFDAANA